MSIEWRGLDLPDSAVTILDRIRETVEDPDTRTAAILQRVADPLVVRGELLSSGVKAVTTADPGLIGSRLGQCQGYKDRLGNLYHDVDFACNFWKSVYETLKALVLSSETLQRLKTIGEREHEANTVYLYDEFRQYELYKQLKEAIVFRQNLLAGEGDTLSRQLTALNLQWTLIEKRGGRVEDLTWSAIDQASSSKTSKGEEDW